MPASKLDPHKNRWEFIALAASIMALNAMAIDIMLPAFPEIGEALRVESENHTQFVLISYLLGFGVGQIVVGPLCDRFGRRIPLLWGLVIYSLAALAAGFAPTFETMIALRVLQGLGAASTRIVATSVVRDTYSGRAMAEIMSLIFVIFMAVPVLAPSIGQLIVLFAPWQFIFIGMVAMGVGVLLWAYYRLPETLAPENQRPLQLKTVTDGFVIVFSNRQAMMYGMAPGILTGGLFAFVSSSQQIFDGIYGLGVLFPFAFGSVALLMSASSFMNARLVGRFGMRPLSHGALLVFTAVSIILYSWSLMAVVPFWWFMVLFASMMVCFGFIGNNFNSMAMEPLGNVAGTASSVFGSVQTVGGALIGALVGQQFDGTISPIIFGYMACAIVGIIMVAVAEDGRFFKTQHDPV
ncbi:multidrug effflux MFS transporter [Cucumibacter marinus]|uniref:multidrug effflux MFS transporter n=1 Tax=Cucumibacter marinus TaxID=1121252 RepID=UPI000419CBED|nr:multidrug effflux MFS transporter [Cucumibacter marinus]